MGEIFVKDKDIVAPGEIIATGMDYVPYGGAFREGENVVSSNIGMVNIDGHVVKIMPLKINYFPRKGDTVIGEINGVSGSNWFVDIGYAVDAALFMKNATSDYIERGEDLTKYYNYRDLVIAKVLSVGRSNIELTMTEHGLRKIVGGKIISINSAKVPRVIGKQGSMINLIKDKTKCRIVVGQNGRVWIKGDNPEDEIIATKAIEIIGERAHEKGLTDEITSLLEEWKK